MANSSLLFLCLILCFHGSLAQLGFGDAQRGFGESHRRLSMQNECRFESLNALEPTRRFESEGGVTEHWEQDNQQFRCAGVAAVRHTIQPRGLLLPSFSNAPRLVYIVQGSGFTQMVTPGCPESYQMFGRQQESRSEEGESRRFRDQHQKIHRFRKGDVIALPAGVAHWCYNDGDSQLITVTVFDNRNYANQLDPYRRKFMLAGSQQKNRQTSESEHSQSEFSGHNLLSGFTVDFLAEAFGIDRELASKLQSNNDQRGEIVMLDRELRLVSPQRTQEEEQQTMEQREHCGQQQTNGLEETFCNMKIRENIGDPSRADFYTPRAGRLTTVNSYKLPILRFIQLTVERGVLYRNAMQAPHWNINAHSVVYCTGGRGRLQIVNNRGRTMFDGELRRGQMVVVPQNFAVLKRAQSEGFEWVSFKTSDNAMINPIVGKTSAFRGMPVEILMNSFRISREQALKLKYNREEVVMFTPATVSSSSEGAREKF